MANHIQGTMTSNSMFLFVHLQKWIWNNIDYYPVLNVTHRRNCFDYGCASSIRVQASVSCSVFSVPIQQNPIEPSQLLLPVDAGFACWCYRAEEDQLPSFLAARMKLLQKVATKQTSTASALLTTGGIALLGDMVVVFRQVK